MCEACWIESGCPLIENAKTRKAAKLIAKVYSHSCCGGGLHIIVDDYNTERGHIDFCDNLVNSQDYAKEYGASEAQIADEKACIKMFQSMTQKEIESAIALHEGWTR